MKTREEIRDMIRDARIGMLTTTEGQNGRIHQRPMSVAEVDDQNRIWFFIDETSHKVAELMSGGKAALGFINNSDQEWLAINGSATVTKDREKMKELWNPTYKAWFPEGLDAPNLALLCIEMEQASYWESKGGMIVTAYEMIKAAITGEPADNGEHAVVRM